MKIGFNNLETGEVIQEWNLNPSQARFWQSQKRVILFSGGFGCGKSLMLVLKAIDLALRYPGNFILMGRQTYIQLRDSLLKEFLVTCPPSLIAQYYKAEMKIEMINGSEIIFRHLDKIAEQEVRSMNLGAAFIDQAEDIDRGVFLALLGRLRRAGVEDQDRKLIMSMNPELTWHYAEFKQNPKDHYELIEASTYENKDNLPPGYIENLEQNYPENYRKQYMEGVWDESLLAGNAVFAREHIEKLDRYMREPIRTREGLAIYREFFPRHAYQMGIDVAEGSEEETDKKDKSSITIVDLTTLEEVAHWSGQLPPDVVAERAVLYTRMFQDKDTYCTVVPEMNSIGLALVNKLNQYDDIFIYRREEFDKSVNKKLKKLGWRTSRATKPLLISSFQERLRRQDPKIRTKETLAEFKTFVHTSESRSNGMAAKTGFHDDRLMSCLLAFFQPVSEILSGSVLSKQGKDSTIKVETVPSLVIVNGKAHFSHLQPILDKSNKWTTH